MTGTAKTERKRNRCACHVHTTLLCTYLRHGPPQDLAVELEQRLVVPRLQLLGGVGLVEHLLGSVLQSDLLDDGVGDAGGGCGEGGEIELNGSCLVMSDSFEPVVDHAVQATTTAMAARGEAPASPSSSQSPRKPQPSKKKSR